MPSKFNNAAPIADVAAGTVTAFCASLGVIVLLAMRAAVAFALRARARHRRNRQARAVYDALRQLDDRDLHDLGFDRSEITSIASEVTGLTKGTRVRALVTLRQPAVCTRS
jgi:uncharacterized protein YjiS (DUF1127 family)